MQTIGFVGVGLIGLEISKHLIDSGYRVVGYRRSSLADFEAAGGIAAKSPREVAEAADIVLSCLPGGSSLDVVVSGPQGLVHAAKPGQIVLELGSHPLGAKERQLEILSAKGVTFLDGEVSGTPSMVSAKAAPIYLAGDGDACSKIDPVVRAFTNNCIYFGKFGAASTVKCINNLLVTVNTAAIGEAVSLALRAAVDPDLMIKAITNGSGGSVLFPIRAPRMVKQHYLPAQGTFEMLSHYFEYVGELAERNGSATPLFDLASDLFRVGLRNGLADHDVAAVIKIIDSLPRERKSEG